MQLGKMQRQEQQLRREAKVGVVRSATSPKSLYWNFDIVRLSIREAAMFFRALRAETSLAGDLRSARSPSVTIPPHHLTMYQVTISSPRSTPTSLAHLPLRPRPLSTSCPRCSGHNRWSKIRHRKGAADAQKSALFSKLINARLPPLSDVPG